MADYKMNSFTIAHYLLLFFVAVVCIGIVAWTLVHGRKSVAADSLNPATELQRVVPGDCSQQVRNQISQIWAYNPELVPGIYLDIATEYANDKVTSRIYGKCNNVAFVCRVGQIRRDCDPCALLSGMQIAREKQIADVIRINCGGK